ncbi:hypothetical protein MRB53_023973 [Persea americana]|uniref:Uncharacterized protein n=1 Tax=Persea americana TaxID=3435 RepID=A0ACC2LBL6_PERAE|nr:hypothetical protein MRB53_023973 [Persea americana]
MSFSISIARHGHSVSSKSSVAVRGTSGVGKAWEEARLARSVCLQKQPPKENLVRSVPVPEIIKQRSDLCPIDDCKSRLPK